MLVLRKNKKIVDVLCQKKRENMVMDQDHVTEREMT
jgi:hypothetical protein